MRFLGEGKRLTVPFFQRSYVWGRSNWEELLNGFDNESVTPFLGSIILKNVTEPLKTEEKMIIDGQQRLTTITILAKAIYDSLPDDEKVESGITEDIKSFLFYKENSSDKFKNSHIKITHSRIDRKDYEAVLRSGLFEGANKIDCDTINDKSSKILQCYKYFREQLSLRNVSQLEALHNVMFSKTRKPLVVIELGISDVNEQCIFDTINRAGVTLSVADIIKNNLFKHLLDKASDDCEKDAVISFYTQKWEPIFDPDKATSAIWDLKRRFGNVEHSNREFLFYCIACIMWVNRKDVFSEQFSELSTVYEKATADCSYDELFLLVHQIIDYAKIFKNRILDFKARLDNDSYHEYFRYNDHVKRLLLILEKFGVQMFYPYVLKRLYEVQNSGNEDITITDFHILESFVMRRKISLKGTHDYTSKCLSIIEHGATWLVQSDLCNNESQITDSDISVYLRKTEDTTAKMILFWIELYHRKEDTYDVSHLEYKYTLEHIMPKKWDTNWSAVPIIQDGHELDSRSEEGIRYRNEAIQQIGNKTLLTGSLNSTIRNSSFLMKINGAPPKKPGYKSHTSLLLTASIVDNSKEDPVWDEAHIFKRTQGLTHDFLLLWPSFSELQQNVSPDANQSSVLDDDPNIDQYTEEQLADAGTLSQIITV